MHTLQVTGASRDQFLCLAPATAAGFSVRTACSCGHCCHLRPTVPPSRATAPSSWASAPPSSARTAAPRGFLAKLDDHLIDLTIRTISVESGGCLRSLLFRPARSPCIFLSEAPTLLILPYDRLNRICGEIGKACLSRSGSPPDFWIPNRCVSWWRRALPQ